MPREYDDDYDEYDRSADIMSVFAEESSRGEYLDEGWEEDSLALTDNQPFATEQHHFFPQEFRDQFEQAGIDVDQYVVDLDRNHHQEVLHAWFEGSRNPEWQGFFSEFESQNETPTLDDVVAFTKDLMESQGLTHHDFHPYRDYTEVTNISELFASEPEGISQAESNPEAMSQSQEATADFVSDTFSESSQDTLAEQAKTQNDVVSFETEFAAESDTDADTGWASESFGMEETIEAADEGSFAAESLGVSDDGAYSESVADSSSASADSASDGSAGASDSGPGGDSE